jgi:hypothetical protein
MNSVRKQVVRFASSPITLGNPTPTKTYFSYILCHSLPMFNGNRDAWTAATLSNSFGSLIDHPNNIEHVQTRICGHVYDAVFVEPTDDTPACIVGASVLYNHIYPDLTQEISSAKNPWSISMECMFGNISIFYDGQLYSDASDPIVPDLLDNLRGVYNGKPVVRVLGGEDGEVLFVGAALTENPADKQAVIQDVATASEINMLDRHLRDLGMPIGVSSEVPIILPGSSRFDSVSQLEKVVASLEEGVDEVVIDRGSNKRRVICHLECGESEEATKQMGAEEKLGATTRPTLCMISAVDCMNFEAAATQDGCANAVASEDGSCCASHKPGFPLVLSGEVIDSTSGAQHFREVYTLWVYSFYNYNIAVYVDAEADEDAEFVAVIYHYKTIDIYARKTFASISALKEWISETQEKLYQEMAEEIEEIHASCQDLEQMSLESIAQMLGKTNDELEDFLKENEGLSDAAVAYRLAKLFGGSPGNKANAAARMLNCGMQHIIISHSLHTKEEKQICEDNTANEDTPEGGESYMSGDIQNQVEQIQEKLTAAESSIEQQSQRIAELSASLDSVTEERDALSRKVEELEKASESLAAEKEAAEKEYAEFKAEVEAREHERVVAERNTARWSRIQEEGLYGNASDEIRDRVLAQIAEMEDEAFDDYVSLLLAAMPAQAVEQEPSNEPEEQEGESQDEEQEDAATHAPQEDLSTAEIIGTDPLGGKHMGLNVETSSRDSLHDKFERLHGVRAIS